jgi:hypothetical protein
MKNIPDPIAEKLPDPRLLAATFRRVDREAVLMYASTCRSVPTMRDGKVVWVPPEEILALPPLDEPKT